MPAKPTLAVTLRTHAAALPQAFPRAYARVMTLMEKLGTSPAGPPYALYRNTDTDADADTDTDTGELEVEAGFPVDQPYPGEGEVEASELPAGRVATCLPVP